MVALAGKYLGIRLYRISDVYCIYFLHNIFYQQAKKKAKSTARSRQAPVLPLGIGVTEKEYPTPFHNEYTAFRHFLDQGKSKEGYQAHPFDEERLFSAFERYFGRIQRNELATKYLSVRKGNETIILVIDEIIYFKAASVYVEAHLSDGTVEILDKTMERLIQILPSHYLRIHRSFIVDLNQIDSYSHTGGGSYRVQLNNGEQLPLSRKKYKKLHSLLNHKL